MQNSSSCKKYYGLCKINTLVTMFSTILNSNIADEKVSHAFTVQTVVEPIISYKRGRTRY